MKHAKYADLNPMEYIGKSISQLMEEFGWCYNKAAIFKNRYKDLYLGKDRDHTKPPGEGIPIKLTFGMIRYHVFPNPLRRHHLFFLEGCVLLKLSKKWMRGMVIHDNIKEKEIKEFYTDEVLEWFFLNYVKNDEIGAIREIRDREFYYG